MRRVMLAEEISCGEREARDFVKNLGGGHRGEGRRDRPWDEATERGKNHSEEGGGGSDDDGVLDGHDVVVQSRHDRVVSVLMAGRAGRSEMVSEGPEGVTCCCPAGLALAEELSFNDWVFRGE
jgi:hypothetical protein